MNQTESPSYQQVLEVVSQWSDVRRFTFVQDVLKTLEPESRTHQKKTLQQALGLLKTTTSPPSDEEVEEWLEEHRIEKYS
jgi:hypothetical protein